MTPSPKRTHPKWLWGGRRAGSEKAWGRGRKLKRGSCSGCRSAWLYHARITFSVPHPPTLEVGGRLAATLGERGERGARGEAGAPASADSSASLPGGGAAAAQGSSPASFPSLGGGGGGGRRRVEEEEPRRSQRPTVATRRLTPSPGPPPPPRPCPSRFPSRSLPSSWTPEHACLPAIQHLADSPPR